jgi:hypothetical protein
MTMVSSGTSYCGNEIFINQFNIINPGQWALHLEMITTKTACILCTCSVMITVVIGQQNGALIDVRHGNVPKGHDAIILMMMIIMKEQNETVIKLLT